LRGDRVGIVGPNGAGKTTLLGLLTGTLAPDSGTVSLGAGLAVVSLDQRRDSLDPSATLAETLTGGHGDTVFVGGAARHVLGYMKDFLFVPAQARTPVGVLSGGERGRLLLARALARPSNLLVLDEPTNDLDLETLDLLQELLADYPGTVLLVSHDRDFLDRVASSVIVWEEGGHWQEYAGAYTDMLAQRGRGIDEKPGLARARKPPLAQKAPAATPVAGKPSLGSPPQRRLTFNQKYALRTLPERIEKLHSTLAALRQALSDPTLYTRDAAAFVRHSEALAAAETELAAAENEWLELEMLREDIEGL
jgi:ATP-binding cassette subfamily F protein uup